MSFFDLSTEIKEMYAELAYLRNCSIDEAKQRVSKAQSALKCDDEGDALEFLLTGARKELEFVNSVQPWE